MKSNLLLLTMLYAFCSNAQIQTPAQLRQSEKLQIAPEKQNQNMKIGKVIEPLYAIGEFPGSTVLVSTTNAQKNSFSVYPASVPNALVDFQPVNFYLTDIDKNGKDELVTLGVNPSSRRVLTFGQDQQNNVKQTSGFAWNHLSHTDEIIFGNFSEGSGSSPIVVDRRVNHIFRYHHNATNPMLPGYTSVMISNWAVGAKYFAGDFNGDGKSDLLGWNRSNGQFDVALWTRANDPVFQPAGTWLNSWNPSQQTELLTGDFNGDKKDDIALVHQPTGEWRVALSTGTSFQPSSGFKSGVWLKPWAAGTQQRLAAIDINADGKCDLAAFNFVTYSFSAVLSNGQYFDHTFTPIALRGTHPSIHQVAIGKFDGRCMLIVAHPTASGLGTGSIYITNYQR